MLYVQNMVRADTMVLTR